MNKNRLLPIAAAILLFGSIAFAVFLNVVYKKSADWQNDVQTRGNKNINTNSQEEGKNRKNEIEYTGKNNEEYDVVIKDFEDFEKEIIEMENFVNDLSVESLDSDLGELEKSTN